MLWNVTQIKSSARTAAILGCIAFSLFVSLTPTASAQDAYLARIYGDGVHSYFRHDTNNAKCRFDTVINEGSRDPRAYYFRAIIALEAGDTGTAASDIRQGAKYELEGRGTYDIWSALARVQGPHRVQFECRRNAALLELRKQSVINRYPLNPTKTPEQLRRPADPYRTDLEPNVPSIYGDDPFLNGDEPPAAPSDDPLDGAEPDDDTSDDIGDDFDDMMDDTQPEVDDEAPFGDEADDPFGADDMGDAPAEELPAGDDNPFGDEMGADDPIDPQGVEADDMGSDAIDDIPADDAPMGDEADDDPFADDGDDPFGDIFE